MLNSQSEHATNPAPRNAGLFFALALFVC